MKGKIKKVNLERWFCFLEDNTFCHSSNFKNKEDMKEGIFIEYEYEQTEKWKSVTKILKILDKFLEIYWENLDYSTENSDLFDKISNDIVNLFGSAWLTSTKLRQYYQIIVNLYNAFERKKEDYKNINELKTEINLLLAKINYDVNRKQSKVPQEMYDFVKFNKEKVFKDNDIKQVEKNFKIFRKHFETVVAYSTWRLSEK